MEATMKLFLTIAAMIQCVVFIVLILFHPEVLDVKEYTWTTDSAVWALADIGSVCFLSLIIAWGLEKEVTE
jgi:hypothetical protein